MGNVKTSGKPSRKSFPKPSPDYRQPAVSDPKTPEPLFRSLLAALALCLLTLIAYSNSFAAGFALDNQVLLLGDPRIRSATWGNLGLIVGHSYWWPNGEAGLYRPLTTISYLFNYAILGDGSNPAGYHWVNLFLHIANVALVFALARRLLIGHPRGFRTAFWIALVWGVHPVLTESVTNIIGRADLLAGAAVLAGFWMYLKSREAAGWRQIPWLASLAVVAAAGALSKESAVVLPGAIVLYELVCRGHNVPAAFSRARFFRGCVATVVPMSAVLWQRALVLAGSPPAEFPFVDNPIAGAGFWIGRLTAIKILVNYLRVSCWPVKLSADYSYSEIPLVSGNLSDWIAWMIVAAILAGMPFLYLRSRQAFFFASFGFLNFLPVSNLLFPIGTIMAERLLYLPLMGLVAAAVIALDAAGAQGRFPRHAALYLACLGTTGLIARTWIRNQDWQDDLAMATATVRASPNSFKAHRLLAATLFARDPAHGDIERVVGDADRSVAILSSLPDELEVPGPWNLAAACHLARGDLLPEADARREYQQAAHIAQHATEIEAASRAAYDRQHGIRTPMPPGAADGYRMWASAYLRLRDGRQALPPALQARRINPANVLVYDQIADAYLAEGRGEDAAIALAEGMFVTGSASLQEDLLKLYQSVVDNEGCAVIPGAKGPTLNPSCDIVHRDLCAATVRAHRPDLGEQHGCRN